MFSRDIQSNIRELTRCEYVDGEARDRDGEMKHRRADYANERRGAQENSLALGDKALVTEKNENKLLTTFEDTPYKVTNKQGKAMESQWHAPEGVNNRTNLTEVKKYLKASDGLEQPGTGDGPKVEL